MCLLPIAILTTTAPESKNEIESVHAENTQYNPTLGTRVNILHM